MLEYMKLSKKHQNEGQAYTTILIQEVWFQDTSMKNQITH